MTQYGNPPHGQKPQDRPHGQYPSSQGGESDPYKTDDPGDSDPPRCERLPPGPKTPKIPEIEPCDQPCCCPGDPATSANCLDDLIAEQAKQIAEVEHAKQLQADLVDLKIKAVDAKKIYTKAKYDELLGRWKKQDPKIAALVHQIDCAVTCLACVIECEICPLLYTIRQTNILLNGNGQLTTEVYSLRDLAYWQDRNREAKQKVVDRFKGVLDVWAKPAETIEKNLDDNEKLYDEIKDKIGKDPAEAIYLLFVKLLPMHFAIAPREETTEIGPEYTSLCGCYPGIPDDCCGPDVGEPSLLQELIGPQPYIVDPDKLFDLICCIATHRYLPAQQQLAAAASDLAKTNAEIEKATKDLADKRDSIGADYKANVGNPINCEDYKPKGENGDQQDPCYPAPTRPAQNPRSQLPHGR